MLKSFAYPQQVLDVKLQGRPFVTKPWEVAFIIWKIRSVEGNVLEVGTHRGDTAFELAKAFPQRRIICVDNNAGKLPEKELCARAVNEPNVVLIQEAFTASIIPPDVGVIYIDGDHFWDSVARDSMAAMQHFKNRHGTIMWHDYYPHDQAGVFETVNGIAKRYPVFQVLNTALAFLDL